MIPNLSCSLITESYSSKILQSCLSLRRSPCNRFRLSWWLSGSGGWGSFQGSDTRYLPSVKQILSWNSSSTVLSELLIPNDSKSQNDFKRSSSIWTSCNRKVSTHRECVMSVEQGLSWVANPTGPDSTHPKSERIATGPLCPRLVSPVMKLQYWSPPIRILTSNCSRPSEGSASGSPARCG